MVYTSLDECRPQPDADKTANASKNNPTLLIAFMLASDLTFQPPIQRETCRPQQPYLNIPAASYARFTGNVYSILCTL
jgi:hypothetical protein